MVRVLISCVSLFVFIYVPIVLVSMEDIKVVTRVPPAQETQKVMAFYGLRTAGNWHEQKATLSRERLHAILQETLDEFIRVAYEKNLLIGFFFSDVHHTETMRYANAIVTSCVNHSMDAIKNNQVNPLWSWHRLGTRMPGGNGCYVMFTIACYVSIENICYDPSSWRVDIRWACVEKFHPTFNLAVMPGSRDTVRALF